MAVPMVADGDEPQNANSDHVDGHGEVAQRDHAQDHSMNATLEEGQQLQTDMADEGDAVEREAARKEWLQYHFALGEWDKAAELVATQDEQDDLDYLMQKNVRDSYM